MARKLRERPDETPEQMTERVIARFKLPDETRDCLRTHVTSRRRDVTAAYQAMRYLDAEDLKRILKLLATQKKEWNASDLRLSFEDRLSAEKTTAARRLEYIVQDYAEALGKSMEDTQTDIAKELSAKALRGETDARSGG